MPENRPERGLPDGGYNMNSRRYILVTLAFVLSASLIASSVSAVIVSCQYSKEQFGLLNAICGEVAEQGPEVKKVICAVLKEYTDRDAKERPGHNLLQALGYTEPDFLGEAYRQNILSAVSGFFAGVLLFFLVFLCRNKMEARRIRALSGYLEQVNTGKAAILSTLGEDDFSKLEDGIYKAVTFLYQTRDKAVQAKNGFAQNLSNIAHQIKTPLTAISLSVQMMGQESSSRYLGQMQKQLLRLTHLEEALLVLSKMDAGTLIFSKDKVDVFTLLVLAADNLQELFADSGITVDIPELGGMEFFADLDWTMEAVMNLMKNCMEHGNSGIIHCSYQKNPLYTEILIWDDGEGFVKEDIPHLFERFYRGHNAKAGGIGIGLALSKEIIERQNGTLRAKNRIGGGASFEIRFYSH